MEPGGCQWLGGALLRGVGVFPYRISKSMLASKGGAGCTPSPPQRSPCSSSRRAGATSRGSASTTRTKGDGCPPWYPNKPGGGHGGQRGPPTPHRPPRPLGGGGPAPQPCGGDSPSQQFCPIGVLWSGRSSFGAGGRSFQGGAVISGGGSSLCLWHSSRPSTAGPGPSRGVRSSRCSPCSSSRRSSPRCSTSSPGGGTEKRREGARGRHGRGLGTRQGSEGEREGRRQAADYGEHNPV